MAGAFASVMSFDYGIGIAEQVAPSTYVSIWGASNAEIIGATISGVWSGGFEYCEGSGAAWLLPLLDTAHGVLRRPEPPADAHQEIEENKRNTSRYDLVSLGSQAGFKDPR